MNRKNNVRINRRGEAVDKWGRVFELDVLQFEKRRKEQHPPSMETEVWPAANAMEPRR